MSRKGAELHPVTAVHRFIKTESCPLTAVLGVISVEDVCLQEKVICYFYFPSPC
jgi:hypothetical protein